MRPAISPEGRQILTARSGGWCEARLYGCLGLATDACHRRRREAWRPEQLSDYWHGCRICHSWTHTNVTEAKDLGLILELWQDPTVEPMAYQSEGWVRLDDQGGVWPV